MTNLLVSEIIPSAKAKQCFLQLCRTELKAKQGTAVPSCLLTARVYVSTVCLQKLLCKVRCFAAVLGCISMSPHQRKSRYPREGYMLGLRKNLM